MAVFASTVLLAGAAHRLAPVQVEDPELQSYAALYGSYAGLCIDGGLPGQSSRDECLLCVMQAGVLLPGSCALPAPRLTHVTALTLTPHTAPQLKPLRWRAPAIRAPPKA